MASSHRPLAASAVGAILIALAAPVTAVRANRAPVPDSRAPTAIELALAEHACGPQDPAVSDAARYQCIGARVDALRADFGYDLGRLTASRRRAIDKSCGRLRGALAREAYVACVSAELAKAETRRPAAGADAAPDAVRPAAEAVAPAVDPPPPPPASASPWLVWLVALVGAGVAVAGAALVVLRVRTAHHQCRGCGTKVGSASDLCPDCRRQAAEALRRTAAERAERERVQQDEHRRREQEAELRAREAIEARSRHEDAERRRLAREEEDLRQHEDEARRARQKTSEPTDGREAAFDPYAVLGLAHDAGRDAVAAAYDEARSKYDPSAVSHLGDEAQSFFRAKAEAVERAYRMLAESESRA